VSNSEIFDEGVSDDFFDLANPPMADRIEN